MAEVVCQRRGFDHIRIDAAESDDQFPRVLVVQQAFRDTARHLRDLFRVRQAVVHQCHVLERRDDLRYATESPPRDRVQDPIPISAPLRPGVQPPTHAVRLDQSGISACVVPGEADAFASRLLPTCFAHERPACLVVRAAAPLERLVIGGRGRQSSRFELSA
jgi:hypothetical protein